MRLQILLIIPILALVGCATPHPINYSPSSTLSASGQVQVGDFTYLPAINGKVKPNQIRNTAIGNAYFEDNIDAFIRTAVFTELRFVGVSVTESNKEISGTIKEFLIDDLGYSVDWTLEIEYSVNSVHGGQELYRTVKKTERNTSKFSNVFTALNETIKLNVEDLIKDPEFLETIR